MKVLLLALVLVASLFLRVFLLTQVPNGFFADEASIGLNAYKLLTTGKDEYEIPHPIFFKAFGEYKNPVQIYLSVVPIALFGLSEFSVRLTSVTLSLLSILLVYVLSYQLFSHSKYKFDISLISALILSITPWHLHFSRIAFEPMALLVFVILSTIFFLRSEKSNNNLILGYLFLIFSLYTNFPGRIFVPLLGMLLTTIYFKTLVSSKKIFGYCVSIVFFGAIPLLLSFAQKDGLVRWRQVGVNTINTSTAKIIEHIQNHYISAFSIDYLFLKGDIDMPGQFITRHSVRGSGELYTFQMPLVVFGLILLLIKNFSFKSKIILASWLILYPTGSMLTYDTSIQATRSIVGLVPLTVLTALGTVYMIYLLPSILKIISVVFLGVLIMLYSSKYINNYFYEYPKYSSNFWGWQFGPKEIMNYYLTQSTYYDDLLLSGEFNGGEIFPIFYDFNNKCLSRCRIGTLKEYDKTKKQIFAMSPEYLSKFHPEMMDKFTILKKIYYPDRTIGFIIGEVKK